MSRVCFDLQENMNVRKKTFQEWHVRQSTVYRTASCLPWTRTLYPFLYDFNHYVDFTIDTVSNSMRLRKRWSLFGSGTGTDYGDASIVVSGAARRGGHRKWRNDVVYVASREHDPHTIDQVLEISGLDRACSYPCGFRGSLGAFMTISTLPQQKNVFHAEMHYLWFSSLISVASGLFRRCKLASKSLWRFASTQWRIWMGGGHIPNPSFSFVYW